LVKGPQDLENRSLAFDPPPLSRVRRTSPFFFLFFFFFFFFFCVLVFVSQTLLSLPGNPMSHFLFILDTPFASLAPPFFFLVILPSSLHFRLCAAVLLWGRFANREPGDSIFRDRTFSLRIDFQVFLFPLFSFLFVDASLASCKDPHSYQPR